MIYHCIKGPVTLTFGYEQFTFSPGQLVNDNNPVFQNHPCFRVLTSEEAIKRAPKLNQIRPYPPDPEYLSHEEILAELKYYNFYANPYEMTDNLAFKLRMVRKSLKRTFITVLDDNKRPVWLDDFKLKDPSKPPPPPKELTLTDKQGSCAAVEKNDQFELGMETNFEKYIEAKSNGDIDNTKKSESALQDFLLRQDPDIVFFDKKLPDKVNVDKESLSKGIEFIDTPQAKIEQVTKTDTTVSVKEITSDTSFIDNQDITLENFSYLISISPFLNRPFTEDDLLGIKKFKLPLSYSVSVMQRFLYLKGFLPKLDPKGLKNLQEHDIEIFPRTECIKILGPYIVANKENQVAAVELNLLQKRATSYKTFMKELFTKMSVQKIRNWLIKHSDIYGVNVSFNKEWSHQEFKRYAMKVRYMIYYGEQIPDTEEEMDKLLKMLGCNEMFNERSEYHKDYDKIYNQTRRKELSDSEDPEDINNDGEPSSESSEELDQNVGQNQDEM